MLHSDPTKTEVLTDADLLRLIFGGKWRLAVLREIRGQPRRLSELRRAIPECSKKVLIDTLHDLEALRLIVKRDLSERTRKVTYSLGDHAERIRLIVEGLE